jgi:hypothetical protein
MRRTVYWSNWGIVFVLDGVEVGRYKFPVGIQGPIGGTIGSDLHDKHCEIALDWEIDGVMPDRGAEDELEVTHANGIAGRPKVTVEETEDDDGLGACQGYGGGRHD